jgi:hypothetical protein
MFARATVDGKGGEVEGKGEANGDGGAVSQGSAREVGESVENKAVAGDYSFNSPSIYCACLGVISFSVLLLPPGLLEIEFEVQSRCFSVLLFVNS